MNYRAQFQAMLDGSEPLLALAPMQDVTTLEFWKLLASYGGADLYVTEYFRVHSASTLRKNLLRLITENPTGRPVIAQIIGNDIPALVRTARELQNYPVVGIDFNLGCPASVVYRKSAGGGLLREPQRIDSILGALRDAIQIKFTVKTRVGFASPEEFENVLPVLAKHSLDLLTVHGRIVLQSHSSPVRYDLIAQAAQTMRCPVLANGSIYSAAKAAGVLRDTGAKGLMIGRGAIRNPWIFQQIRQQRLGHKEFVVTGRNILQYLLALYDAIGVTCRTKRLQLQVLKKYLTFFDGLEPTGGFLYQVKRAGTQEDFFRICTDFLDHGNPMAYKPA